MAGHRPWPVDPTELGAFDYDEITAALARPGKSKADRRKIWGIESRIVPITEESIARTLGLDQWFTHGRYLTAGSRDIAFAMLTNKAERELRGWSRTEWRKTGPDMPKT